MNTQLQSDVTEFAREQHKNQCYGKGDDYFTTHVQAVVSGVYFMIKQLENDYVLGTFQDVLLVCATLHDYFEDCNHRESSHELFNILLNHMTVEQVELVADVLLLLTKTKGETTGQNLVRIKGCDNSIRPSNYIAAYVKLADANYNAYRCMLRGYPTSKYVKLCTELNDFIGTCG